MKIIRSPNCSLERKEMSDSALEQLIKRTLRKGSVKHKHRPNKHQIIHNNATMRYSN